MSLLGHYVPQTKSEDLHQQIYKNHLVYLGQEDSPAKIEKWNNLEGLIAEYLALVPHKKKFACVEVSDALHRSIVELPNFSALKAALVFQALEKYATNLLSHPWRKEHSAIKLYSGFYKHSVESHILGAERILVLMGYVQRKDLVMVLEEPVDPDGVAKVALDCLVAYVECQIMIQVWEKIQPIQCSWADIHHIREEYICSIDEAVRLLQQIRRANGPEKSKLGRDNCGWNTNDYVVERENKAPPEKLPPKTTRSDLLLDITSKPQSSQAYEPSLGGRIQLDGLTITRSKSPSWTEGLSASRDRISAIRNNLCSWETDADSFHPQDVYWDNNGQNHMSPHNKPWTSNYDYRYDSPGMANEESWDFMIDSAKNPNNSFGYGHSQDFLRNEVPSVHSKPPYAMHYRSNQFAPPGSQFNDNCACRFYHHPPQPPMPSVMPHHYSYEDVMPNTSNYRHMKLADAQARELDDLIHSFQGIAPDRPVNLKEEVKAPPNLIAPKPKKVVNSDNCLLMQESPPQFRKRGSVYDNLTSLENERLSELGPPLLVPKKELDITKTSKKLSPKPIDPIDVSVDASKISKKLAPKLTENSDFFVVDAVKTVKKLPPKLIDPVDVSIDAAKISKKLAPKPNDPIDISIDASKLLKKLAPKMVDTVDSPIKLSLEKLVKQKRDSTSGSSDSKTSSEKVVKPTEMLVVTTNGFTERWPCTFCTFINEPKNDVCEMCSRSRHRGSESTPLVSGGRECPHCTLVNDKSATCCIACESSLKDSPTYI